MLFIIGLAGVVSAADQVQPVSVNSPDGKVEFTLTAGKDGLVYAVSMDGNLLLKDSPLGLIPKEGEPLGPKLGIRSSAARLVDETYTVVCGKQNPVRDHYRLLQVELSEPGAKGRALGLSVRAYDDGIAFRYQWGGVGEAVNLDGELSGFQLVDNATAFAQLGQFHAYEHEHTTAPVTALDKNKLINLPVTFQCPHGLWMAITEADLIDYAGLYLALPSEQDSLFLAARLQTGKDKPVVRITPFETPWRVVLLGRKAGDLIESNIVLNCNPPCAIEDPSWIKPGKVTWNWWPDNMANGVDFKTGLNTATMKHYAKFAAEAGFQYLLIDDGWSYMEKKAGPDGKTQVKIDLSKPNPELNLQEVLAYCQELGVGVLLWMDWGNCASQMQTVFPLYESWGVKGVKVDFMGREDQWMVNWYREVVQLAAKHHLLVDFHGAYKPTGERRTWPNQITQEAVRGLEHAKWGKVTPTDNLMLPFTRMLAGPMDYTPGGFDCRNPNDYKARGTAPVVLGTRCHQLAQFVVFESPLQMCVDYPENYRGQAGFEFLRVVPATWDETRVFEGMPGEYILMARRHGHDWFIGAMTSEQGPRKVSLPLSFLEGGKWQAELFADGEQAAQVPNHVRITKQAVSPVDTLEISMVAGGGFAAWLKRL